MQPTKATRLGIAEDVGWLTAVLNRLVEVLLTQ